VISWMHAETVNDAETLCGLALYPQQEVKILRNPESFSLRQRIGNLGPLTVGEIAFGADVRLECGELHDSYHVNIPITGHIESEHRGVRATADSDCATVYQPEMYTVLPYWSAQTRLLCVKFDRCVVDDALRDALGNTANTQINFEHTMQIQSGGGRTWTQMVMMLYDQLSQPDSVLREPLVALPFIDSLVRGLLVVADHPHRSALVKPVGPAPSRLVATAVEITPMAYLREVRLRRAHRALVESDPSVNTVASIAHRWGFTNLGRFAETHTARYGESPGVTLRRTLFRH
jgi:hypothetical protein